MAKLWRKLKDPNILKRGWHLARLDTRNDFAEDLYSTESYGQELDKNIRETINRISTGTFQPKPLFRLEVPKGTLTFRPGTVVPIHDRVVISSIVLLLAPELDKRLPKAVYSWRLKKPLPTHGNVFPELDIADIPFLKRRTIRTKIDPFAGWYQLWPKFDETTRKLYQDGKYRYLATSDISAYFENIQLPILRDQLLKIIPREPEIINLLCSFLEAWADRTNDGRVHYRGIPQGNFVSSFLGNIFLLPLDSTFKSYTASTGKLYYRYMDDVRVFTEKYEDARNSVFEMARKLRELHLNVQTAKTRIYDEGSKEISKLLIDSRVDRASELIDSIQKKYKGAEPPASEKKKILHELAVIAKEKDEDGHKIIGARKALEGLTLRLFSRWVTAHLLINSAAYIDRLISEIEKSADYKLTKKLISTTRKFPRKQRIEVRILELITTGKIIFPYQEAECLRALRYLSTTSPQLINHAWTALSTKTKQRYLRMEAAYLIGRTKIESRRFAVLKNSFETEADPYVKIAIASLLVQQSGNTSQVIRTMVFSPNEKLSETGRYFKNLTENELLAKDALTHAFSPHAPWLLCDYIPILHVIASSKESGVRKLLISKLKAFKRSHPIVGLRPILSDLYENLTTTA